MKKSELKQMIREELIKEASPNYKLIPSFLNTSEYKKTRKTINDLRVKLKPQFEKYAKENGFDEMNDSEILDAWYLLVDEFL